MAISMRISDLFSSRLQGPIFASESRKNVAPPASASFSGGYNHDDHAPSDKNRYQSAGEKRQQPLAPIHFDVGAFFDQAAPENGGRAGNDHLVERTGRVGERNEYAAADVAATAKPEHFDHAFRYRGHDDEASDSRRHQEGQQKDDRINPSRRRE